MEILLQAVLVSASIIVQALSQEMLPSYNGALTEITCVTTVPSFFINGLYSSRHYNELPDRFGIEARVAPDRKNVTLHINGSGMVHNITVKCQNLTDSVTGQTETLFQFTLFNDAIPAPHRIQYNDKSGILTWYPPRVEDNDNIRIVLRITHYIIYVTDLQTGLTTNFTTSGPETSITIFNILPDMPCPMSIQVSAVNPAGEGQRSTSVPDYQCSSDVTTKQQDATTGGITDTENSPALSYGGTTAVVIALAFVATIVVCITLLIVCFLYKYRRNSKTTKSKRVANEEDPKDINKPRASSEVSDSSEDSQTKLLTPSSSPMTTPKQPAITHQQVQSSDNNEDTNNTNKEKKETQLQCTQGDGQQIIYAELTPPVVNPVSQPSSVENTAYAIINHTNQD